MAQSGNVVDEGKAESATDTGAALYDKIASEALAMSDAGGPSDKDTSAVVAKIVEKLKEKNPLPEGASEEPLWDMARSMYWDWKDAQRKKEKSGTEECSCCEPDSVMD